MRHHTQLTVFLAEMGFLHVGQAGVELLTSGDPPALAFQSARNTGVNNHVQPDCFFFSLLLLLRWDFVLVAHAEVQWCDLGSLHPPPPGFK